MYYEIERLLRQGERVVITGLMGTGKSYLVSRLSPKYYALKNGSWWSTQWISSKEFYDSYKLFDRCPWIDRYVFIHHTQEPLELCIKGYIENLPDTYIFLMLNDRFRKERDGFELENAERERLVDRFLEIGRGIYQTGKVKGVIINTPGSWMSTDFWTGDDFWEVARRNSLRQEKHLMTGRIEDLEPELFDKVVEAANNYYNGRDTGMGDFEYDTYLERLKSINPSFNIFDYVVYETDSERVPHTVTLPNFEKVNFEQLDLEYKPEDVVLTAKYDGASLVAYYRDGKLQNIITRSNEVTGIVQTQKLWKKVPHEVHKDIRAILFEATTESKRQDASGLINSKYKQDEVDEKLFLNPFDCVLWRRVLGYKQRMDLTGLKYDTLTIQQAKSLKGQGDEPVLELEREGKIRKIPVDGIVAYGAYDPSYGRIYKFYSTNNKESTVTNLHYDVSRDTGLINVVVEFEPVRIGSTNVKRCGNAGSWSTILQKKLGVGSTVQVFLTKVTIPQIASNTPWTEEPHPTCPWCGHELVEFQNRLICPNDDCTFWEDFFETKYFNILREYKGSEWVDEFTVQGKFDINMMIKAEIETGYRLSDFMTKPIYLFYMIEPPRIKGATYEQVKERLLLTYEQVKPKDTFELAELVIGCVNAPNQKEYARTVWDKLAYFLRKVARLRKQKVQG